jgi:hypothetical protein
MIFRMQNWVSSSAGAERHNHGTAKRVPSRVEWRDATLPLSHSHSLTRSPTMKGSEPSNNPSASKPTARASATMRNRGSPAQTFKRSPSLMASPRRAIPEIAQPLAPFDHAEISDAYNKKDVEYEESARRTSGHFLLRVHMVDVCA